MSDPIIVVGAGQAAAGFAARHVALGNSQPVLLIGDEALPPYDRPPLSKKFLLGDLERERLLLRPVDWYSNANISMRLSTRIDRIDPPARQVVTGDGETLAYDKLLLCTGSSARRLPARLGGDLEGVYTLRTVDDVDRLAPQLTTGRRLLIVGGGYIGLEVAASARRLGVDVTVLEMAQRILQRVAAEATSEYFRRLHTSHGVDLRESTQLVRLLDSGGRVSGAELDTGEVIAVDLVLVGIGGEPNTSLAEAAGLDCNNGIAVDSQCRTSVSHVYAAGDCCSFERDGRRIRLESVQNASDQGQLVAGVLAGKDLHYDAVPWFWSDQYDCSLQIAGLNLGHTETVLRQEPGSDSLSVWYYADGRLLAVDAMNDVKADVAGRKLLQTGKSPEPEIIADPATDLKALLKG